MSKSERTVGRVGNPQVDSSHYLGLQYDSKGRFASYWHQINEILRFDAQPVLEIGVGNGFLSSYLKQRGVDVTTMDIDEDLEPDVVGSILDIPFDKNSFEVIACFEVLEHIPYAQALEALCEMQRVANRHVVLSIPDRSHMYGVRLKLPFIGHVDWQWSFERFRPLDEPLVEDEHFWELGVQNYTLSRITSDIENAGFDIINTYRVSEKESHRFFVLESRS